MLETFCAAANIKALMQRCDVPILKEAEEILKHCCTPYGGQDFVTDMNIFAGAESDAQQWSIEGGAHTTSIPDELRCAWATGGNTKPLQKITTYKCYSVGGIQYATRRHSNRDCFVFFTPNRQAQRVPGVIEYIFSAPFSDNEHSYFIAIQRNLPVPEKVVDPFLGYEDFGAQLWSNEYGEHLEIVTSRDLLCHAISMTWEDDILVMKPLDKAFGESPLRRV
ncbi:hypothetical protein PAXINDRAFT_22156 [Paxillus involutus ATCC 200175]|uniref:Uncharacterized protein n=1 Tax=Paxillus involutus ATCC 200175 TaxID=664439 RepID=A0A0C9SSF2_PAXIN|nr:hypothetical protein PAXINDRAFT_22156 [Paxillus involutus ATCC 200175]